MNKRLIIAEVGSCEDCPYMRTNGGYSCFHPAIGDDDFREWMTVSMNGLDVLDVIENRVGYSLSAPCR